MNHQPISRDNARGREVPCRRRKITESGVDSSYAVVKTVYGRRIVHCRCRYRLFSPLLCPDNGFGLPPFETEIDESATNRSEIHDRSDDRGRSEFGRWRNKNLWGPGPNPGPGFVDANLARSAGPLALEKPVLRAGREMKHEDDHRPKGSLGRVPALGRIQGGGKGGERDLHCAE